MTQSARRLEVASLVIVVCVAVMWGLVNALQGELSTLETKLAAARRFFNNAVSEYNASIQAFPAALFARSMGFAEREFFDIGTEARQQLDAAPPQVKF